MFKTQFIEELSNKHKCTKKEAESFVEDFFDIITVGAKRDGFVQITGKGTFEFKEHKQREAVNPRTKETVIVEASNLIRFKPGKDLKNI